MTNRALLKEQVNKISYLDALLSDWQKNLIKIHLSSSKRIVERKTNTAKKVAA